MRLSVLILISALLSPAALAAPARKAAKASPKPAAKPAGPVLKGIIIQPSTAVLVGPRSQQRLVVTGNYADGSVRDLTGQARYASSNLRAAKLVTDTGPMILPVADGSATITAAVAGATPVTVAVQVKDTKKLAPISFKDEVVPALTKAGCSQGICHGTPTGKGGLKLSLQGYAPDIDYTALVREGGRRRTNPTNPGRSLLLLKPMAEMPHGGGKRLSEDMPEYQVLVRWIAEGAREDPADAPTVTKVEVLPGPRRLLLPGAAKQQVVAMATFSDGSVRDVTHLAKLDTSNPDAASITREGLVHGAAKGDIAVLVRYQYIMHSNRLTFLQKVPGFHWNDPPANNFVDREVFAKLKLMEIPASGLSSDAEFVRRAYLDTVGLLPPPAEVRKFLQSTAADKREKLIDELTQRPEFADFWAVKWADVLRISDDTLGEGNAKLYHKWIRDSLAANKSMGQFVQEILTAKGSLAQNPAGNFFRAAREADGKVLPDSISQATSQLFLGVRMTCAKCHNHPFERWTQDDYYHLAAFFGQVRSKGSGKGDDSVVLNPEGEVEHLRTGRIMEPRLLGAPTPAIKAGEDPRRILAAWVVEKDNPFFAKSLVNRVWANMLGRGIVEPIDDFRDSNPPVNEGLLEALSKDFVASNFDFRHLVRTIMKSRTYQLAAKTVPLNKDDLTYFSHALPRLMTAEQLADAIVQITGVPDQYKGYPMGTRAMQVAGTGARTDFLKIFGRPERNLNCECEREKDPTLFQALKLLTDRNIHGKLRADDGKVAKLAASDTPNDAVLEEFYFAALSRPPSPKEKQAWASHFGQTPDRRQAFEDLAWVLINSKEFLFRH